MPEFKLAAILLLYFSAMAHCGGNDPEVVTPLGRIRGSLMSTRNNRTIYAFRGIRYGKSTEGPRRFKQAEPVDDPWTDTFDASKEGPTCPRIDDPASSSEDCLRLNVYSNCLPGSACGIKRPVIVFFHPGAFYIFSAQSKAFGPQYFLDQDIVLVTVGYRIATLGMISTGDARAPGNLGLKDQVVALRWVRDNIAPFGGDPNSVTIAGHSAGSWSCILHMMSPMSVGLFHRVIAMSGSPTTPEPLPTEQKHLVIKQASFVGCPTDSLDVAFECLKTVPFQKLADSLPKFAEWYGDPVLIWSPVVEPKIPGVERFLTAQPVDLIRQGKFQHVPVMIGITKDEFSGAPLPALERAMKGDDSIYRNITANWEHAAPISFQYERETERSKYISKELKKFYLNDEPLTVKNGKKLGLIYADSLIGWPAHRGAMLLAEYSKTPVYNYQFTFQGRYSFAMWKDTKKPYGVVHHDDLQYLFYMSSRFPFFTEDFPETYMVKVLTSIWKSFADSDQPIPKHNELFKGVSWTPLDPKKENYLDVGDELKMKNKMFPERYALWDRLFPLKPILSTTA
ncbi:esterase E4-like [Copidosoma floridanum]|uniref:esterase E4-like n=1 Tax=Copidosoma floridanum TaxID=29053 RepID=UPI0006C95582|nr:esterase E4-like [Copidosoma floridanum]